MIATVPNVSCMHRLWIIALQYTIEYTLCEPSIVIKKGIFRLCSLETKNSAVPLCFRIPNPALRRVTCAIRTLLMPSASQNLLPDALSAQTCGDCSQPMAFPLWRRLSAYSFRSMHFPICSFQRYRRCSALAICNFPKYLLSLIHISEPTRP